MESSPLEQPCRAPTCWAAAFHPRGPAVARAPGGSTCRVESICHQPQWRGSPAQLSTLASAAAPCLGGSSGSWPQLALSCDGAHRPWGLADPLARRPLPLAREHSHDDTGLEQEGGDGGLRDSDAHGRTEGLHRAGGGCPVWLFPTEFCKMPPSPSLAWGCEGTSRRRVQRQPRC